MQPLPAIAGRWEARLERGHSGGILTAHIPAECSPGAAVCEATGGIPPPAQSIFASARVSGARPISQAARSSGLATALGLSAFSSIVFVIVLIAFVRVHPAISVGAGILAFAESAVAVYFIFRFRARMASGYYEAWLAGVPEHVDLGASLEPQMTVQAKRDVWIGDGQITLHCEEHAISRGGTSDTHYRKTIFEQKCPLAGARQLRAGEQALLKGQLTLPPGAVPTLRGRNNFIEWKLRVRVPLRGYCPDIREDIELHVTPRMAGRASAGVRDDAAVPQEWLGEVPVRGKHHEVPGVHAQMAMRDAPTVQGLPAMTVGATRRLDLTVSTTEDIHCRAVLCWVGCRIHGSGTDEEVVLEAEHAIHEGDFRPTHPISHSLTVTIPDSGPVTFVGRYVKCEWMVRLRVDIPIWRDKRIELPFIVTPRLIIAEPD